MDPQQAVLVLMGVSGSGKSTVAGLLAGALGWDLEEGDDLHPDANVAKMTAGEPLTDADRWPWLDTVASWIQEHTLAGRPGIVTCSALKRSYRNVLSGDHVVFVHFAGSQEQIGRRLATRHDHYMPASLLDSQFATLEPLAADERAVLVDIAAKPTVQAAHIIEELQLRPEQGYICPEVFSVTRRRPVEQRGRPAGMTRRADRGAPTPGHTGFSRRSPARGRERRLRPRLRHHRVPTPRT